MKVEYLNKFGDPISKQDIIDQYAFHQIGQTGDVLFDDKGNVYVRCSDGTLYNENATAVINN